VKAKNLNFIKGENPLGPNIPIDYHTNYKDDYIKYSDDVKEPVTKNMP